MSFDASVPPFPEAVTILSQDWSLRASQSVEDVTEKVFCSPRDTKVAVVGETLSGAPPVSALCFSPHAAVSSMRSIRQVILRNLFMIYWLRPSSQPGFWLRANPVMVRWSAGMGQR